MLETLDTPIVVTDRTHLSQLEALEAPARILLIEDLQTTAPDEAALSRIRAGMIEADPLYVNFTSWERCVLSVTQRLRLHPLLYGNLLHQRGGRACQPGTFRL